MPSDNGAIERGYMDSQMSNLPHNRVIRKVQNSNVNSPSVKEYKETSNLTNLRNAQEVDDANEMVMDRSESESASFAF